MRARTACAPRRPQRPRQTRAAAAARVRASGPQERAAGCAPATGARACRRPCVTGGRYSGLRADPLDDRVARRLVRRLDHEQAQPQAGALEPLDLAGDEELREPRVALEQVGDRVGPGCAQAYAAPQASAQAPRCSGRGRSRRSATRAARGAEPPAQAGAASRAPRAPSRSARRIAGRDEEPGDAVDHRARDRADVAGDHRAAARHRLEDDVRQAVAIAARRRPATARRRRRRRAYSAGSAACVERARELDDVGPARPSRSPPRAGRAAAPRRRSAGGRAPSSARSRLDEDVEALLLHQPPDGEQAQRARRPGGGLGRKRSRSTPCGTSAGPAAGRARPRAATSALQAITQRRRAGARAASSAAATLRASRAWTLKPYGTPSTARATARDRRRGVGEVAVDAGDRGARQAAERARAACSASVPAPAPRTRPASRVGARLRASRRRRAWWRRRRPSAPARVESQQLVEQEGLGPPREAARDHGEPAGRAGAGRSTAPVLGLPGSSARQRRLFRPPGGGRLGRSRCRSRRASTRAETIRPRSISSTWSAVSQSSAEWVIRIVVRSRISSRSPSSTCAWALGVEARRRLVEHEHGRVAQQGPGDPDPLPLAPREPDALRAELGLDSRRAAR